jgi:asparagine synthase (glutamine-hydrolysing)
MSGDPLAPTTLEILAGSPIGPADAPALPPPRPGRTAREALESTVAVALERQPCLVTFSGGRDSSAVLAVAIHVARREGLPLPVPITVRFSNAPGAGEPRWQELVIAHLGLGDWEVIELGDELDLLGPAAQRNLLRHGVRYPSNCAL